MTTDVRAARADEAGAIGGLLADAFFDDPIQVWILPDPATRLAIGTEIFTAIATGAFAADRDVYVTDALSAVSIWAAPGTYTYEEPLGLPPAVSAAFARIWASHPKAPHQYLEFNGVRRAAQGHGHGSAVLGPGLASADAAGAPSALWTGHDRNLDFYGTYGYRVLERLDFPPGPSAWWLWRDTATS
ncbi:MAG: hypothetical protein M3P16_12805 [Chloroflexota bacterium]|nr:hypothetical protein [Chloroflexota bacterium]